MVVSGKWSVLRGIQLEEMKQEFVGPKHKQKKKKKMYPEVDVQMEHWTKQRYGKKRKNIKEDIKKTKKTKKKKV